MSKEDTVSDFADGYAALAAIADYLNQCESDLVRTRAILKRGTHDVTNIPLTDEWRAHYERVVELRIETLTKYGRAIPSEAA